MLIRIFLYFLLVIFTSTGCKSKTKPSNINELYFIGFKPANGLTATYIIVNDITIGQQITEEKTETRNKTESELLYEFVNDNSGSFVVNTTYLAFQSLLKTPDEEKIVNAATASKSDDPAEQIFGLFHQKKFNAILDSAGQIKEIKGIDDFLNKVKEATKYSGVAGQSFINEAFFKKALVTCNHYYPGKPVRINDSWILKQVIDESLNITSERTLKLERVENGVAYINITGVIVNDKANMNVAGQQVNISFDGGEDGYINIDINTGLIVKSKISAKGEGSITVMNRSVPLTFKSTTEISKKK
jgi:hypothetical protein